MSGCRLRILFRPGALHDLENQLQYLDEHASEEIADRCLDAVSVAVEQLLAMPGIGSPRAYLNSRLGDLRMWTVPHFTKYLILYRPTESIVEIVRILHGAQSIEDIMRDEP